MHHMHAQLKVHICAPYTHTCTTKTHVHHQIPPKYKIYPVGLPSVLYETPGPNERSVLNQLFLVLFIVLFTFQVKTASFSWKPPLSWKPQHFSWKLLLFMKTAAFHKNHRFSWKPQRFFIVSFWVITKYRSFVRKTKQFANNMRYYKFS